MNRRAAVIPVVALALALAVAVLSVHGPEAGDPKPAEDRKIDVAMPNKSSRPGCEETDSCYVPSEITMRPGSTVTWQNQDVAFHSVTSGSYGNPTDLFDSGHMDPGEVFVLDFEEEGTYDYFCTLHPWMKGRVVVGDIRNER